MCFFFSLASTAEFQCQSFRDLKIPDGLQEVESYETLCGKSRNGDVDLLFVRKPVRCIQSNILPWHTDEG